VARPHAPRSTLSGNCRSDAAEVLASSGSSDDGGDLLHARSSTGGMRSTSGTRTTIQLKANLFATMQEEIGTARRMVRVSRDALTSELSLGRCCSTATTAWRGRSTSCRTAALRASPPAPTLCRASASSWERATMSARSRWQRADVCRLARAVAPVRMLRRPDSRDGFELALGEAMSALQLGNCDLVRLRGTS
jgi:hypothetical protein